MTAASEEQEKHGEAGTIAQRTFSAIRTVVSFGGEYKEIKEFVKNLDYIFQTKTDDCQWKYI